MTYYNHCVHSRVFAELYIISHVCSVESDFLAALLPFSLYPNLMYFCFLNVLIFVIWISKGMVVNSGPVLCSPRRIRSKNPGARGLNVFSKACSSSKPPWGRSSCAKTPGALEAGENCTRGDSPENGSRAP